MDRRTALATLGLAAVSIPLIRAGHGAASAEEGSKDKDDGTADFLFVQEAQNVKFEGDTLTLLDASPKTLYFTDRPKEFAGYMTHKAFLEFVSKGPDNFEKNPPNATLVVFGDGGKFRNVVVKLPNKPTLVGKHIVFKGVKVTMGKPDTGCGACALFIDTLGRPVPGVNESGVDRDAGNESGVHRWRRRRSDRDRVRRR